MNTCGAVSLLKKLRRYLFSIGIEKNFGYVSIGNIVNTFFGAVLWLIITSRVSAEEFGGLNYDISLATLFTSVGIMGFDTTLTAYLAKGVTRMLSESLFLIIVACAVISIILLFVYPSIAVILLIVSMLFFTLIGAENLGNHNFKKYMWLMISQRFISLFCVPVFYFLFGIEGAIYGFTVSYLLVSYELFKRIGSIKLSISTLIPIKHYFFHSYILGVAKTLPYFFDKLLILPLFGLTVVGYYQFGVQVLSIISIFPVIFYGYLLPKESRQSDTVSLDKYLRIGLILSSLLSFLLILCLPTLVEVLFPKFQLATIPAQIILLAGIPLTMSSIYNSMFMARDFSWNVVIGTLIFIGVQSLGIITLGSIYGLIGLSISTTIAATLQCIYLLFIKRKFH
jgi:O-antigen/teichoic acid export membrane protein